jgi:hypothetical protein
VCVIPHQLELAVAGKSQTKFAVKVGLSVGALIVGARVGARVGALVDGAGVGTAVASAGESVAPGKILIVSIEMSPVYDVPLTPTHWIDVVPTGT